MSTYLPTHSIHSTLSLTHSLTHSLQVIHEAMFSAVDYTEIKVAHPPIHAFFLCKANFLGMWLGRLATPNPSIASPLSTPSCVCAKLIMCSQSADDILLRDELDALQRLYPDRLTIYHVVDEPPIGWAMGTHLDEATITEMMPSARETREGDAIIMVSGPDSLLGAVAGEVSAP